MGYKYFVVELNQLLSLPSYRMAVVNGLFWLVYCLLFYARCLRKPKSKTSYTPWLLLLSVLPVISIFRQGTYESGDLSLHATRLMAFWEAIEQGELIPRWAGSLNGGYGYPLFQFIYPLPYYLASFWHWIGFGFINSIKITIALAYVLSGLVFFRLAKKHVSDLAALLGAVLYLFAPYHLVDLHFRVAFGEIVAFLFLPLTMVCGVNFVAGRVTGGIGDVKDFREVRLKTLRTNSVWLILTGLAFAGLVLAHQAISLITLIIVPPYLLVIQINTPWLYRIKQAIKPLIIGLVLSAFYWVPVLIEGRYTLMSQFAGGIQFQNIREFLYSPWRAGLLFQGPKGELSFLIGYVHIALVMVAMWKFVKGDFGQQNKVVALFCLLLGVWCLLLLPFSKPVWNLIPLLHNFQFTYRLLVPIALVTSMIGALFIEKIKQPAIVYVFIFFAISATLLNWGNRRTIPEIDDSYLRIDLPYATMRGEGLDPAGTRWSDINTIWQKEPTRGLLNINKNIVNYQIASNLNSRKVIGVFTDQPTLVEVNQLYFPGWVVKVNGETKPILYELKNHYGMIAFHVPTGESQVSLAFQDTFIRKLAGIISLLGGIITVTLLLRPVRGHKGN